MKKIIKEIEDKILKLSKKPENMSKQILDLSQSLAVLNKSHQLLIRHNAFAIETILDNLKADFKKQLPLDRKMIVKRVNNLAFLFMKGMMEEMP